MRQEWGRSVAKMNADNLAFGRKLFEDAEEGIEDMIIADNIKTMQMAAQEVQDFIMSAPISIRVQGFLAGIVVFLTTLLSMIVNFLNANVLVGLIHLVFMLPALLFIVIEYKVHFACISYAICSPGI